jgi:uncharacterized protein
MNSKCKFLPAKSVAALLLLLEIGFLGMTTLPAYSQTMSDDPQLTIASYNVKNLDPKREEIAKVEQKRASNVDDDLGTGRFKAIATQIVQNLKSPDIIALQEIQDNDGAEISAETQADKTGAALIKAIKTAGGPTYIYRDLSPVNGQDGGQPGGNIRTGFLVNTQRVQLQGDLQRLPDAGEFQDSRKPLVGKFKFGNQTITIINNHFVSKSGGAASNTQRLQQATSVNTFVKTALTANPQAHVIVLGDLNDTADSAALEKLSGSQLKTLMSSIPIADRYTYIFKDKPELIDHILVSPSLQAPGKSVVEILHLNNGSTKKFASDHDPILSRYNFAVSDGASGAVLPPAENMEPREPILKDLAGTELLQKIAQNYSPKASLGYRKARDLLYTTIDNQNGIVTDIYGGFEVNIAPNDPAARTTASRLKINAEHVWPQSQGAQENAKSDLHNLSPLPISPIAERLPGTVTMPRLIVCRSPVSMLIASRIKSPLSRENRKKAILLAPCFISGRSIPTRRIVASLKSSK